jgi:hypothetical protein
MEELLCPHLSFFITHLSVKKQKIVATVSNKINVRMCKARKENILGNGKGVHNSSQNGLIR